MSKKKPELIDQLNKSHRRRRLANTVTIDSIYEKNFLSMNSVLEAVVINADLLPGYLTTPEDILVSSALADVVYSFGDGFFFRYKHIHAYARGFLELQHY